VCVPEELNQLIEGFGELGLFRAVEWPLMEESQESPLHHDDMVQGFVHTWRRTRERSKSITAQFMGRRIAPACSQPGMFQISMMFGRAGALSAT
jgi:hypothetical protein